MSVGPVSELPAAANWRVLLSYARPFSGALLGGVGLSMATTALAPPGSSPQGLAWPRDPHWHNFVDAWNAANFLALFRSSTLIVLGVVQLRMLRARQ